MRQVRSKETVDRRGKDFLTDAEMQRFLDAARHGRHGVRDYLLMLMAYRHGMRVSELVTLRLRDLDLDKGRVYVRRKKGKFTTKQASVGPSHSSPLAPLIAPVAFALGAGDARGQSTRLPR